MKEFAFLYPIPEHINYEIENHGWHEGGNEKFKKRYGDVLNKCIDLRYRQKDFGINFITFNHHPISDIINVQISDRIIEVDIEYKTHTTERPDGTFLYPNQDKILDQLPKTKTLTIAGFHLWDCVEKLAKRAWERNLDVLVDEDLTELLVGKMLFDSDFRIDKYPTFNPRQLGEFWFKNFMNLRKGKPWLWQKY